MVELQTTREREIDAAYKPLLIGTRQRPWPRQALFSGVQFDKNKKYNGNFEKTDMKQYLQTYFAKEMQVSREVGVADNASGSHANAVRSAQREEAKNAAKWGL